MKYFEVFTESQILTLAKIMHLRPPQNRTGTEEVKQY